MRLMQGQKGGAHRAEVAEDGSLRLALEEGAERLPWLQGEEDEEDEVPGPEAGRILAFALGLLLVLAVLAGGGWWLWQEHANAVAAADGSIIAAPAGPYKMRPADAGGQEVAGTGATSFQVAEGRQVEGRIASEPTDTAGSMVPAAVSGAPVASGAGAGVGASYGGFGVQIGAYPTREAALAGWQQMSTRLPPLGGRTHRILEGTSDSAPVFRLQVVAAGLAEARDLCRQLRAAGGDCQVKR